MSTPPLYHNSRQPQPKRSRIHEWPVSEAPPAPLDTEPYDDPELPAEGCALVARAEALAVRDARSPQEAEVIRTGVRSRPALTALWVRELVEEDLARERPGGDDTSERARRLRLRLAGS